jgi:subtilisin family serine protease
MNMKHVILRSVEDRGPRMRGKGGTRSTRIEQSSQIAVECDNLSLRRVAEVARKRGVEAVAPVIRMKLIEPVAVAPAGDLAAKGGTWGVRAIGADTSPFSGEGVIVAVLDTGIDATHPAFAGVKLVQKNFTSENDEDLHGHGTHCAGTIFGRTIAGTRIGVAPGVTTAVIGKVLGEGGGGSDVVLEAIQWALQNGVHVISMSLGIDFPGYVAELEQTGMPTELATSKALEGYRANVILFERLASLIQARSAFMQPCAVVAAAGNESRRDENSDFEIGVSPPAVADGIVSVAAVGSDPQGLVVAPFSNIGARLAAPGVDVLSARRGGGLTNMSGTSMATPHVAGVAALWAEKLQAAGQFTGPLFMNRLLGSATVAGLKAGFDPVDVGAGIVRAPQE